MRNKYTHSKPGGIGGLLKGLGFLFAFILAIGLLDKAGVSVNFRSPDKTPAEQAYLLASTSKTAVEPEEIQDDDIIVIRPEEPADRDSRQHASMQNFNFSYSPKAGSTVRRDEQIEEWIENFSSTSIAQALRKGIPAGLSLAVGISKLKAGEEISSGLAFMKEVIEPLARIKRKASRKNLKSYFQYTVNSDLWAEGLGQTGVYSASMLKKNLKEYALRDYDYDVRTQLSASPSVDPEMEWKANYVADEVGAAIRDQNNSAPGINSASAGKYNSEAKAREWAAQYDETVGHEVAKVIARRSIKGREYLTEEDLAKLVQETNEKTKEVLDHKLAFPGRKINKKHPGAVKMLDITDPKNSQAREELYQKKLKEKRLSGKKRQ